MQTYSKFNEIHRVFGCLAGKNSYLSSLLRPAFLPNITISLRNSIGVPCLTPTRLYQYMAGKRIGTLLDPPILNEGLGAQVRRSIGSSQLRHLDPFLLVDHYFIDPPHGFPTHPHRGFQGIYYVLSGALLYDNNKGQSGTLMPGDVQCLTMGKGILHAQGAGQAGTQGITIWLNQKGDTRLCPATSVDITAATVPKVQLPGAVAEVLAGPFGGAQGPCITNAACQVLLITMQAGSQLRLESPSEVTAMLYVIQGEVNVEGQVVSHYQLAVFENIGEVINFQAQTDSKVLFLQAPRLGEPSVQYGPYVMSSRDEVLAAQVDFNHSQNGFEGAQAWQSRLDIR